MANQALANSSISQLILGNATAAIINDSNNSSSSSSSSSSITTTNNQNQQQFQLQPEPDLSILTDEVSQTKLVASLVLFIITLLCGYLPVRCLLNQNYIQYAMFAGGGVLMATAFCHLIPEAHDNYKMVLSQSSHQHDHHHSGVNNAANNETSTINDLLIDPLPTPPASGFNVPYLEVTLCCGFFFMYLAEQLMVRFINNHTHEHPCDSSTGQLVVSVGITGDSLNPNLSQSNGGNLADSSTATSGVSRLSVGPTLGTGSGFYKFVRGLLIVSAFGAHSIFDGVAIGSQESVEKVWTIFLAISCHKLIIAAVVGLELYAATLESHFWTIIHLSIFSIMSPIGIILVVVAQSSLHLDSNHPAMILLQSFATGTLLYIVFVEILQPKEGHAYEKNRFGKSVSLIAGFALMLLVLTLIDE